MAEIDLDLAVQRLEADISDRRGLKWEWNKIDEDVKAEIRETWKAIIAGATSVGVDATFFAPPARRCGKCDACIDGLDCTEVCPCGKSGRDWSHAGDCPKFRTDRA